MKRFTVLCLGLMIFCCTNAFAVTDQSLAPPGVNPDEGVTVTVMATTENVANIDAECVKFQDGLVYENASYQAFQIHERATLKNEVLVQVHCTGPGDQEFALDVNGAVNWNQVDKGVAVERTGIGLKTDTSFHMALYLHSGIKTSTNFLHLGFLDASEVHHNHFASLQFDRSLLHLNGLRTDAGNFHQGSISQFNFGTG